MVMVVVVVVIIIIIIIIIIMHVFYLNFIKALTFSDFVNKPNRFLYLHRAFSIWRFLY